MHLSLKQSKKLTFKINKLTLSIEMNSQTGLHNGRFQITLHVVMQMGFNACSLAMMRLHC